jgi:hypothetical protein
MLWRRGLEKERDLEREIQSHLDLEAEEQRDSGTQPEQARCAAQRAFGNTTRIREQIREM